MGGFLGSLGGFFLNVLAPIILVPLAGYLGLKLKGMLDTSHKLANAQLIGLVALDAVGRVKNLYPGNWTALLDQAITVIVQQFGVSQEIAQRAVLSAAEQLKGK